MIFSPYPKVYIVLLNWNGRQDTVECIDSVRKLQYPNFEVVVVDNASTDDSVSKIREEYPDIDLIESPSNLGYAGGNNIGLRYAINHDADYIWILNNDTEVDEKALSDLVRKMKEDVSLGMCGSRLIYYHQRDTLQALGGGTYNKWTGTTRHLGQDKPADSHYEELEVEQKLDYIVGASLMVSRNFVEEVGLFSEDYFLYYEELDWAERGRERFNLGFAGDSIVYHKEGSSTKGTHHQPHPRSLLSDYYQLKNRLKFTWKYYPYMLPFVYLTILYAAVNRMKRGQWDRIPMILKIMAGFDDESLKESKG